MSTNLDLKIATPVILGINVDNGLYINPVNESVIVIPDSILLIMYEEFVYDTGSLITPKIVQVFDAEGNLLGFSKVFDTTWKIVIPATGETQTAEINIIY